jgi:hypothetical protein
MKYLFAQLLLISFISCQETNQKKASKSVDSNYQLIVEDDYELHKPVETSNATLILFGGFPENAEDIKREFKILETAKKHHVSVFLSNLNQKLWLEVNERKKLAEQLQKTIEDHKLETDNIFIGGFSSGGNVALLISNYLKAQPQYGIQPKGTFIVDSPVDLARLYQSAEKNIERNFSEVSVQEGKWLISMLDLRFEEQKEEQSRFEKQSVVTLANGNIDNISSLRDVKIRFYTKPDTLWWKKNRKANYEDLNAYSIKKLDSLLRAKQFESVEYIESTKEGIRSNGMRHPHSWSIVDTESLIKWMLKDQ